MQIEKGQIFKKIWIIFYLEEQLPSKKDSPSRSHSSNL